MADPSRRSIDLKPENIMLNFPCGFSFNARHKDKDRDRSSSSYDPWAGSGFGSGYGCGRRRDVVGVKIVDFGNGEFLVRV
jgi:serine/threonine protein kinase